MSEPVLPNKLDEAVTSFIVSTPGGCFFLVERNKGSGIWTCGNVVMAAPADAPDTVALDFVREASRRFLTVATKPFTAHADAQTACRTSSYINFALDTEPYAPLPAVRPPNPQCGQGSPEIAVSAFLGGLFGLIHDHNFAATVWACVSRLLS